MALLMPIEIRNTGLVAGYWRLTHVQLDHEAGQPDALLAQLSPYQLVARRGRVALGEHQVDARQHQWQPLGELVGRRHAERYGGVTDLGLGPYQPLGDGRLGLEERPGDLGRLEPAHQP